MESPDALLQRFNTPMEQSFCVLPWLHRFTNLYGEIQVCCVADEKIGHLRHDSGKPFFIQDAPSETEIANSAHLRRIRTDMLAGRWPAACSRCLTTEETGGTSRRVVENERFKDDIPWILSNTDADGFAPLRITSRDYRLGNLCNLKCRMCSPDASILLIDDLKLYWRHKPTQAELDRYRNIDWFRQPAVWEAFRSNVHDLRHLHFAGGEPLVTPETLKAIEICIEEGCAKNIELTFNTNVTKLPPRMTDLWPHFRGVSLLCSIDAHGALNDYIRSPSRWSAIDANLRTIDRKHVELNVISAQVNATVQIYNVFHLDALVEYCHREFEFIRRMPYFIFLTGPTYFSIQVLPNAMKDEAKARLTKLEERLRGAGVTQGFEQLHGIASYMDGGAESALWLSEFRRVTSRLDRARHQSVTGVAPELGPLMRRSPRMLWGELQCLTQGVRRRLSTLPGRLRLPTGG